MLKNTMLSVAAASALVFAMSASAAAKTGFYVGAEAGYGYSDLEKLNGSKTVNVTGNAVTGSIATNRGGFDGRVYVGYRISQYFGVELGGEYLPHSNYKLTVTENNVTTNPTLTFEQYSFDMLVKGFIPFNDQFFGFVGAGPAYVLNKTEVSSTVAGTTASVSSDYQGYVRPKATAGLGYNINSNLALTVSYGHIFGDRSGTDLLNGKRGVVDINTFTAGVQYTF